MSGASSVRRQWSGLALSLGRLLFLDRSGGLRPGAAQDEPLAGAAGGGVAALGATVGGALGVPDTALGRASERRRTPSAPVEPAASWAWAAELATDGLWDWDRGAGRVRCSARAKTLLGYAQDELGEEPAQWLALVHPDDLRLREGALARHAAGETATAVCEYRLRCRDGAWRWVLERCRIVERDAQGKPWRIQGTLTDIAERKRAERSLAQMVTLETVILETSRALLAAQPEAVEPVIERVLGALARRMDLECACVYQLTPDGLALRASHEWCAADVPCGRVDELPVPLGDMPRWMETLRHGEDILIADVASLPDAWGRDRAVLQAQGVRAAAAVPLRTGERLAGCVAALMNGCPRDWRESELRAMRLLGDLIGAALERRRLARDLLESRQRLEEVALYDALTGLPNRRLLAERMRTAMALALESGTELAVCYLDLDRFKPINDLLGAVVGDRILVAAAGRLRAQVRESDTVARLGGDELVLLLGGFETPLECTNVLDRLINVMSQPYTVDGQDLRVTASGGVTLYPRDNHDADTLLRHADHAMYQAKQHGRNRYVFFDTVRDRRAHVRRSQLARLGEAIDRNEMVLFYQPKVDMRRGRVIGAEGLVRWQHPQMGLLPPRAFIPLLDGSDLQQRLDWWVIAQAMRQLATWQEQGLDLGLSVNISARSVQHQGFAEELQARLADDPGLARGRLSMEILESEALVDLDTVAQVIQRCEDLGVGFALDDFGTGYSSLTYFRRLPAQVLKIDQTFVRDLLRSQDDRNIVEGVVGLARAFRREVIAEGVESAAHGLMLLRMGCEHAQGFGVAEPMPADRLPGWVARYVSPVLWSMSPDFDWSGQVLEVLAMESAHRDWVARVLRAAGSGGEVSPPELSEDRCVFGRWYYGDGRRLCADLEPFRAIELLHREVHDCARALLAAVASGAADQAGTETLLAARDRFIGVLHALQEQVLRRLAPVA